MDCKDIFLSNEHTKQDSLYIRDICCRLKSLQLNTQESKTPLLIHYEPAPVVHFPDKNGNHINPRRKTHTVPSYQPITHVKDNVTASCNIKPLPCNTHDELEVQEMLVKLCLKTPVAEKPFSCTENFVTPVSIYADENKYRTSYGLKLEPHVKTQNNDTPYSCNYLSPPRDIINRHSIHTERLQFSDRMSIFKSQKRLGTAYIKKWGSIDDVRVSKRNENYQIRNILREKYFLCSLCNFKTPQRSRLNYHMKIHPIQKPFSCTECDYRTSHKSYLNHHARIHTGEKPLCRACISQYKNLKQHTVESTVSEKLPRSLSGYKTSTSNGAHLQLHTDGKPFSG